MCLCVRVHVCAACFFCFFLLEEALDPSARVWKLTGSLQSSGGFVAGGWVEREGMGVRHERRGVRNAGGLTEE